MDFRFRISDFGLSGAEFVARRAILAKLTRHGFAFDPHRAVLKVFFLPDGHDLLQAINRVVAGFKSYTAMGRSNYDDDARFAYFYPAKAMNYSNAIDGPFLVSLIADLRQRLQGHLRVSFVLQVKRAAAFSVIARDPVKDDD